MSDPVQVLHRDLSTQNQLAMLLAVSDQMTKILLMESATDEEDETCDRLAGEPQVAAETTLIKACTRIDSIIEDDRRWGLDFQIRLEKLFEKNTKMAHGVAERQKKTLDEVLAKETAQKELAVEVKSPHNLFRPTLFTMPDGAWVAFLGDPQDMNSGILGSGTSPATAMKQFDLAFEGQLTKAQQNTIETITHEQQQHSMDQVGPEHPEEPNRRGPGLPPDSGLPQA